jgi:BirA family biotin operon repressor/biotin-[acetyl-CoA-carboxylase] ligase
MAMQPLDADLPPRYPESAVISDPLDLAQLNADLIGTRFAGKLQHFATIGSTNTDLLAAAAAGASEGTTYIADEQTAGRGRGGHAWHSAPAEGLYVSALVHPPLPLRDALHLSLATGLAAQQAIHEATGVSIDIRWPNDLLVGTKKLGGILVETAVEPGSDAHLRYAVIGIGINVQHTAFPPELASIATSLALESHYPVARQSLLLSLLRHLDAELTRLESADTQLLHRFIQSSSWATGKRVHVPEQGGYTGTTAGLDARGFLLVDADDGARRTVLSGGVREI